MSTSDKPDAYFGLLDELRTISGLKLRHPRVLTTDGNAMQPGVNW
jgi:hypothetical protein